MSNWVLENYRVKCTDITSDGKPCNAALLRAVHSHSTGGYSGEIEVCLPENEFLRAHVSVGKNTNRARSENHSSPDTPSYGSTDMMCPKCGAHHHFSASETASIVKSIRATIEKYQSGS